MHPVFTPVTLRTMTVKNRIARSATHDYIGNETGYVSDLQADIWEELAQNDLGLFITGHLYVDALGQASASQNALDHDRYIPALARAVKRVQRHGCKVVAQLSHAGAKATPEVPLAPSAITLEPGAPARAMTKEEIAQAVAAFAAAAGRAQAAGCDGGQIHCAHLLHPPRRWVRRQPGEPLSHCGGGAGRRAGPLWRGLPDLCQDQQQRPRRGRGVRRRPALYDGAVCRLEGGGGGV